MRVKLLIVLAVVALSFGALGLSQEVPRARADAAAEAALESESRADAVLDARKRLEALVVPPESHPVPILPNRLRLDGPGVTIGSRNFFDLHSLWVSPRSPAEIRRWFISHVPLGSTLNEYGAFGIGDEIVRRELGFQFPDMPEIALSRGLRIGIVPRGKSGSAFRADAQGVWIVPHPLSEQIPADANVIEPRLTIDAKIRRKDVVTDPGKVAAITELIDGLIPVQPYEGSGGGFCECGPKEKTKVVELAFRRGRYGPVLATVSQQLPPGFRNSLEVEIGGHREDFLEEGWRVTEMMREQGILLR